MQIKHKLIVGLGVAALAVPAAAVATPGGGHGGGTTKSAQYNVKGTYAGDGVVTVTKASGHARKAGWKGEDVAFDFSSAEIRVADTNLDGTADINDVVVGVNVKVQARLPKRDPGAGPYVAQRLVDATADDDDADVATADDDDVATDDDLDEDETETETETE